MTQPHLQIREEGSLHKYRTEIPNTVVRGVKSHGMSIYAKWLYVYLKSVTGDTGECFRSTTTIATESGISRGRVSAAKKELVSQGLITVKPGKNPHRNADHIGIKDIWLLNMQEFSVHCMNTEDEAQMKENQATEQPSVHHMNTESSQCSPHEHQCSPHEHQCSPHEHLRRSLLRRSQEEEDRSLPSGEPAHDMPGTPPSRRPKPPSAEVVTGMPAPQVLTPAWLVEVYNTETPPDHPKVTTLTEARRKKAMQRLKAFPDAAFWHTVMTEICHSPLLLGLRPSAEHPNFRGDFDWLLGSDREHIENCVKVAEGKYRDRARPTAATNDQVPQRHKLHV